MRGCGATTWQQRAQIAHNIETQEANLSAIAINTGGRAFIKQSNLTKAIDEIVSENGSFYLLGYSPTPLVRDGKFHEIKVHVSRPGARFRARHGYVAPGSSATATTTDRAHRCARRRLNITGLSLRAHVAPVAASAKGLTSVVAVDVTYPPSPDGPTRSTIR